MHGRIRSGERGQFALTASWAVATRSSSLLDDVREVFAGKVLKAEELRSGRTWKTMRPGDKPMTDGTDASAYGMVNRYRFESDAFGEKATMRRSSNPQAGGDVSGG